VLHAIGSYDLILSSGLLPLSLTQAVRGLYRQAVGFHLFAKNTNLLSLIASQPVAVNWPYKTIERDGFEKKARDGTRTRDSLLSVLFLLSPFIKLTCKAKIR
jgi:hypothetical protein